MVLKDKKAEIVGGAQPAKAAVILRIPVQNLKRHCALNGPLGVLI